jgi:hypothetical protein
MEDTFVGLARCFQSQGDCVYQPRVARHERFSLLESLFS